MTLGGVEKGSDGEETQAGKGRAEAPRGRKGPGTERGPASCPWHQVLRTVCLQWPETVLQGLVLDCIWLQDSQESRGGWNQLSDSFCQEGNESILRRSLFVSNLFTLEASCWYFWGVLRSSHQIGRSLEERALSNNNSFLL